MAANKDIHESQWNSAFLRVKAFIEQHNRNPKTTGTNEAEPLLGAWLTKQQRKYQDGKLRPDRENLLGEIGALVKTGELEFIEKLNKCADFIQKNSRPPSSTATDPAEKSLYYWRSGQLHSKNIGKLSPHRQKLLEDNGIFKTAYEHEWRSFYERLEHFVQANKRLPIRISDNPVEASLGQWRQQQFILYKSGKLSKEKAQLLEKIGAATTILNINWGENFRKLHTFVSKHNLYPSRSSQSEDERQIARWLETQLNRIKKNELSTRRKQLVESLKLPVSLLEMRWERTIKEVRIFLNRNGRLPSNCARGPKERSLAVWCQRQRIMYSKGKLKPAQFTAVEELGLHLIRKSALWRKNYKQVYLFIKENGRRPKKHVMDPEEKVLGRWCDRQRYLYSQGELSSDRVGALRTIKIIGN